VLSVVPSAIMTRRELGFLLIGLGTGLILAVAAIIEFFWFHHMFINGVRLIPATIVLALPFLFVLIGVFLPYRRRGQPNSN
jgi:hypothetical protein